MSDCIPVEWDLPRDILVDIFRKISALSLARCSCVATFWREVMNEDSSLKRKIGLERAWLHEPIEPIIHKDRNFEVFCCVKMKDLIALGGYHELKVFDLNRREFVFEYMEVGMVQSLCFMDGMLLSGTEIGYLSGWDISTWKQLSWVRIFKSGIWSIADLGKNVAIGGEDGDLQIWRKGVWEFDSPLEGHKDCVYCILPQPGNLLISGSRDKTVRIWNLVDNACLRVIRGQKSIVKSLGVSDGLLFRGAYAGDICLWDFDTGEYVGAFPRQTNHVASIVIREGRLFIGSLDRTIEIWDIKGVCVRKFDCPHNQKGSYLEKIDVLWVDDENMIAVRGNGEIWEWNFSKGL